MTPIKVAFVNLGCRVNRVEIDAMMEGLAASGVAMTDEVDADVVVINTCAVTGEAEKKTRKAIRHAASMSQRPVVIATGCVASLFSDELASLGDNVVVEPDKSRIVPRCLELAGIGPDEGVPACDAQTLDVLALTGRVRPGVKVQDGCDNRCTYCIVWKARGAARSVSPDDALAMVRRAVSRGASEVVLTGINLGRYEWHDDGVDLRLPGLLDYLLSNSDVGRLRLSSVEPPETTPDLLSLMAGSGGRIAPFLHLPLQSGCDGTLARMGRTYDAAGYQRVVDRARELVDGIAIACDLIVGFPGETDVEFAESLAFCERMGFSKMHVFRYSRRPGTPAASAPAQVDPHVMAARGEAMRSLARSMRSRYVEGRVGHDELVCVERPGRGTTGGLVDILVDRSLPVGELAHVVPHLVIDGTTLDGRTS